MNARARAADEMVKRAFPTMLTPKDDLDYYAVTVLGTGNAKAPVDLGAQTVWCGFTETKPPREIRRGRLVYPDKMLELWRELATPGIVVNDEHDVLVWMRFGGNAVIEKSLAERHVASIVIERPVGTHTAGGHTAIDSLPRTALQHAPTPVHRMNIIKRDGMRCRICGRSPENHVDVELHVHHIRPWGDGGLTEDQNLITLCHTCHKGLKPHYEPSLFVRTNPKWPGADKEDEASEYWRGVKLYNDWVEAEVAKLLPSAARKNAKKASRQATTPK